MTLESRSPSRSRTEPSSSWYTECFNRSHPHDLQVFLQACETNPGHSSGQLSQGLPSDTSFIRTPVSENAPFGLLVGVPFILSPVINNQTKRPTNRMPQNFFTDTCGIHCRTRTSAAKQRTYFVNEKRNVPVHLI